MNVNRKILQGLLYFLMFAVSCVASTTEEDDFDVVGSFASNWIEDTDFAIRFSKLYVNKNGEYCIVGQHRSGGDSSRCKIDNSLGEVDFMKLVGSSWSKLPLSIKKSSQFSVVSLIDKKLRKYNGWCSVVNSKEKTLVLMRYEIKSLGETVDSVKFKMYQIIVEDSFWVLLGKEE